MDLTLPFWVEAVDKMLAANAFDVLHGAGHVSHEEAQATAADRYDAFDAVRRLEEARLADEADMEELHRIEEAAQHRLEGR